MDQIDKVITKWNDCSKTYADETESVTLQSAMNLYNLVNVSKAKRIIDAGCGPGLSSQVLMNTLMKSGSTLYWVDIAEKMIDLLEEKFKHEGWINESHTIDEDSSDMESDDCYSQIQCQNVTSYQRIHLNSERKIDHLEYYENNLKVGSNGKRVFSMVSDIEQLPFPDSSFDAYVSNLVIQFTPNYISALFEAQRVLWKGGKAAFSVWGREENCTFLTFLPDILDRNGIKVDPDLDVDFTLLDPDQIMEDAKDLGFSSAKKLHLPFYYSIMNGQEMWEFLNSSTSCKQLQALNEQTRQKVKEDVIKEFDQRFGEQTDEMISLEVTVILCTK